MGRYRLMIYSLLNVESPLCLGSGRLDDPFTDIPVLRDTGKIPFLPGGALAGGLAKELSAVQRQDWLGHTDESRASRVIMDDAYPLPKQEETLGNAVDFRSGNALLRDSLTIKPGHYFSRETLPAGTSLRFCCRFDGTDEQEIAAFKEITGRFLHRGQSGAADNAGLGCWSSDMFWSRVYDLGVQSDLLDWLENQHGFDWSGDSEELSRFGFFGEQTIETVTGSWQLQCEIEVSKGLHLSAGFGGLPKSGEPDRRQARRMRIDGEGELIPEPVDFGSTVRGRFRTAMELLLRTWLTRFLELDPDTVKKIVPVDPHARSSSTAMRTLFGFASHGRRATGGKSVWRVSESAWSDYSEIRQDHLRLDEFTQQAIDGFKFDCLPLAGGRMTVQISLDQPEEWHKVLCYHAANLLAHNVLPWGGGAARGYVGARLRLVEHDELPEDMAGVLQDAMKQIVDASV